MRGLPSRGRLRILATADEAAIAAADEVRARAIAATDAHGRFTVALSGGSTPVRMYRALRRPGMPAGGPVVPWAKTHVFWGDERTVAPNHPDSNFGSAQRALLSQVQVPTEQTHRMRGEDDPERAAEAYADTLRRAFKLTANGIPRFDVILLGLGPDGHTASLFPEGEAVAETERLVAAPWVAAVGAFRLTLTPVVLNHARNVVFLVAGAEKADALRAVFEDPIDVVRCPAQVVRPTDGDVLWVVDRPAAANLSGGTPRDG